MSANFQCGENGLNIADRQNAHSASMAVNAILQLYREAETFREESRSVSRAEELHRKILIFSISHDHIWVNIYGHYALIDGAKITFHRHPIRSFNLTDRDGNDRWTAYKFVRKVYDHFAPIHLKRIQSAVARLREPDLEPCTSVANADESEQADSQEMARSAPTSQDTHRFKKPKLPLTATLQKENEQLNNKLAQERDQIAQEREQCNQRLAELMNLMTEQAAASNARIDQLLRQNEGLMSMLKPRIPSFYGFVSRCLLVANFLLGLGVEAWWPPRIGAGYQNWSRAYPNWNKGTRIGAGCLELEQVAMWRIGISDIWHLIFICPCYFAISEY
jgi:hypothetical protein